MLMAHVRRVPVGFIARDVPCPALHSVETIIAISQRVSALTVRVDITVRNVLLVLPRVLTGSVTLQMAPAYLVALDFTEMTVHLSALKPAKINYVILKKALAPLVREDTMEINAYLRAQRVA